MDKNLNYKLGPFLEEAYNAQVPTAIQKEFKETDQRVSLLFNSLEGDALRLFPIPDDENNKWVSPKEFVQQGRVIKDSLYSNFIKTGFLAYLATLQNDKLQNTDFTQSKKLVEAIKKTQQRYGGKTMLSEKKIKTEITYNKYDIFKRLFLYYFLAGLVYFVFIILQIFNSNKKINNIFNYIFKGFKIIIFGLFILHTIGLIARGYVSGHAPWSDAYESMIYVAWATMGIGLLFAKKSDLTIASTAFVASMILMIAHWNWMDPSIANLVPVLDSYWLMIHVSIIVGSYGPFALGMILGIVSLLLMILSTSKNSKVIKHKLSELTIINELALTIGLVMLTIGNFLGGMWANESWGRYWGWDPKETWALISILVYAFVLHMRLIPKMRGTWLFNLMSIIAFASIVMTYFGVNFYLVGLHSYASGDKVITPDFVYYSILFVLILGIISKWRYNKFLSK